MAYHTAASNHPSNNYFYHLGHNYNVVFHFSETSDPHRSFHESDQDRDRSKMSSQQAIYAFTVTVLLNLVQIKYQTKTDSPFETRPKTMFLAFSSLLLYSGLSYYSVSTAVPYVNCLRKMGMRFCGTLTMASFITVLLPGSVFRLAFCLLLLLSFSQLLPTSYVQTVWKGVTKAATFVMEKVRGQPPNHMGGGVQVQLPWFQVANGVEMLPV